VTVVGEAACRKVKRQGSGGLAAGEASRGKDEEKSKVVRRWRCRRGSLDSLADARSLGMTRRAMARSRVAMAGRSFDSLGFASLAQDDREGWSTSRSLRMTDGKKRRVRNAE